MTAYSAPTRVSARHAPPEPVPRPPTRAPRRWLTVLRYATLYLLAAVFLLPIYVLVVTSLKAPDQVSVVGMWQLPHSLSLDSFGAAWPKLARGLRNSVVLAVPASLISSLLGAANGFALAKWQFRGSRLVFPLILFGIFVPYQAVIIPLVQVMNSAGLRGGSDPTGGLRGLLLVHIIYGLPLTTLVFRNYYLALPGTLLEAAQLDGATMFRTFIDIGIPLARPAFAVSIIWQFTAVWNDFLFGAVMTTRDAWPVTIALNNIAGGQSVPFNEAMAGALLACLPTLAVYIFLSRYLMRGLLASSLQR